MEDSKDGKHTKPSTITVEFGDSIEGIDLNKLRYLLAEAANTSLENAAFQSSFSKKAFKALTQNITVYINDIVNESVKNSKRDKVDNVSASHVDKASAYLVTKRKGKFKGILGAVGGVFLGSAVQEILGMVGDSTAPTIGSVLSISACLLVGTLLVAWNLLRD
ncbi:MAG: hypothetical protein HUU01_08660 [Saprospiraceae bacterium]|nr:hypothetical protein [Saprospiraceae bacterium]